MSSSMMYMPRWNKILVLAVVAFSFIYAAPNLLSKDTREQLELTKPGWMPIKGVNLGLDLQGGSHLLLQVDLENVIENRQDSLAQAIRPELREAKIGYTRISTIPQGVRVTLRNKEDAGKVRALMMKSDSQIQVTVASDGMAVEGRLTEAAIRQIKDQTIGQSIEIVRRRVDESGTREPSIARQGEDRIVLQLPGLDNPQRIKELLGRTAKLSFHMVSMGTGADMREAGGTMTLPMAEEPGQTVTINRRALLTGDMLTNAQPNLQQGMPVVSFSLNGIGAKRFCEATRKQENIGKPFAIVLDDTVISAPAIREPICGGAAVISGSFTLQETNDLSLLLRAGALPAPLHVLEERTVGPSLGADSVEAGRTALLMAILFVTTVMCLVYGLFGIFAAVTLIVNVVMIIAIMSILQATLTLPGIAGIVLTIGLAVDANVLIFERMKEELRAGRSVISAMDAGYHRALATITDSNLTSLIAALVLFSLGAGPIKGFAVTMCIGIVTSFFCALMLSRMMILTWLQVKKPKTIAV